MVGATRSSNPPDIMTPNRLPTMKRRRFLKGVGAGGAVIGEFTRTAMAKGKEPLDDIAVDLVLNYSIVGQGNPDSTAPDTTDHYGYPFTPPGNPPTGGFYFAYHDPTEANQTPENPSLFNTSDIEMTPNGGTLHHTLRFFAGFLITKDSKPKPYPLVHKGEGRYESRGQVMNFEAKKRAEIPPAFQSLPPFQILTAPDENLKWRAVGTDRVQLVTENGSPTTEPEWGLTRVDFYSRGQGKPQFTISLLYVIWNPDTSAQPVPPPLSPPLTSGIPLDANAVTVNELILPGRLNMGGQTK